MEGNALPEVAFGLLVDPDTFNGTPALALLIKDFTYIQRENTVNKFLNHLNKQKSMKVIIVIHIKAEQNHSKLYQLFERQNFDLLE